MYDVAIIGSGPAGLTAAIYSARANLSTVLFTGDMFGGQIATTNDVENYPGFTAIAGPDLSLRMREQAEKFGTEVIADSIIEFDPDGPPFKLTGRSETYEARSVIVASGASPRYLGVPGEQELWGRGVSYCATCDGAFFQGMPVAVVGGGDSALQEGLFLTRFASKVSVIHRRDELRAGAHLRQRAEADDKIEFVWDTAVTEIQGKDDVTSLALRNLKTGEEGELGVDGVFIFIGHFPNSEIYKGKLEMDDEGYIVADAKMHTSVEGVFAAGEAQDHYFRQAITAAGEGCMASMEAEKFIAQLDASRVAEEPAIATAGS